MKTFELYSRALAAEKVFFYHYFLSFVLTLQQVGMETLDEPKLASALADTVEDGKRLEALWNKHMSAAISASPELATMPGMQKLARCVWCGCMSFCS